MSLESSSAYREMKKKFRMPVAPMIIIPECAADAEHSLMNIQ
jgi:hypothetical protein